MHVSLNKKLVELKEIDTFVDGAAVKKSGKIAFELCKIFRWHNSCPRRLYLPNYSRYV